MSDTALGSAVRTDGPAPPWLPARRINLSEDVADQLIERILQGTLKFGEKLPPERDLASLLGVGRPTIREAIRTLSVIGLVEVRHGEGTFIVNRHAEFVAKAFSWTLLLDPQTASDLIDVRMAVECQQARLAARNATSADAALLSSVLAKMTNKMDLDTFFVVDLDFHRTISMIARNVALDRLLVASRSLLRQWIQLASAESVRRMPALIRDHRAIVDAIAAGDEEAADAAMRKHAQVVGRMIAVASQTMRPELRELSQRGRFEEWPWGS